MSDLGERQRALSIALVTLFALAPSEPTSAAPRDRVAPRIEHQPLRAAARDQNLEVRAEVFDDTAVMEVSLNFRNANEERYTRTAMSDTGLDYVAVIPADMVWDDIEYFIEAFDTAGNGPARVGTPTEPLLVKVLTIVQPQPTPPPETPPAVGRASAAPQPSAATSPPPEVNERAARAASPAPPPPTSEESGSDRDDGELSTQQWLGVGAVGLGALGLAGAAMFLVDYMFFVQPSLEEARTNMQDPEVVCPGFTPSDKSCFDNQIETLEQAATGDLLYTGAGLTVAVLSGVAAFLLFTHEAEDDEVDEVDEVDEALD